eukprot:6202162-Pleurochrysis_carterae.AAC.6
MHGPEDGDEAVGEGRRRAAFEEFAGRLPALRRRQRREQPLRHRKKRARDALHTGASGDLRNRKHTASQSSGAEAATERTMRASVGVGNFQRG